MLMISVSIMVIIALVGALMVLTLNTQQTFAEIGVGSAGQSGVNGGNGVGGSSGANGSAGGAYCFAGVITPACK
jgi:hypothetical protein